MLNTAKNKVVSVIGRLSVIKILIEKHLHCTFKGTFYMEARWLIY